MEHLIERKVYLDQLSMWREERMIKESILTL